MSEDEEPEFEAADRHRPAPACAESSESHQPSAFDDSYVEPEPELVSAPARPKFAELAEESAYTPLPRDYASDLGNALHAADTMEERRSQPVGTLYGEQGTEQERDLDVPAFMRRLQF
jgi:hypothetical protein